MGERSTIEWTDATWTPIRARNRATGKVGWHCEHVSEGCRHCYSEGFNRNRLGTGLPFKPGHRSDVDLFLDEQMLTAPLRWRKPRRVFVCSMTDLFASFVPDEWIDRMFAVMALCPQHTFQVLTKRPERMRDYLTARKSAEALHMPLGDGTLGWHPFNRDFLPPRNVWLGTSVEDQAAADQRIPHLLATPAAVRFLSCEPLLGPVLLMNIDCHARRDLPGFYWINALTGAHDDMCRPCAPLPRLDWIIVGGESGRDARPMHPDWARSLRDQCAAAGVPFFFKQWGEWTPAEAGERQWHGPAAPKVARVGKHRAGRLLDGVQHDGMPHVSEVGHG